MRKKNKIVAFFNSKVFFFITAMIMFLAGVFYLGYLHNNPLPGGHEFNVHIQLLMGFVIVVCACFAVAMLNSFLPNTDSMSTSYSYFDPKRED